MAFVTNVGNLASGTPSIPGGLSSTNLTTSSPNLLPKLWKRGIILSDTENDFLAQFCGRSNRSIIVEEYDTAKGAGQLVYFRTMAGLYGDGVIGDELIQDRVEAWRTYDFSLKVDWFRHATRWTRRTETETGLASELANAVPEMLGSWLGRKRTTQLLMMFLHKGTAQNTIYANNKANRNALRSADTIDYDSILTWGQMLKTIGAKAPRITDKGKNAIEGYTLLATGEGLVSLKTSDDYKQSLENGFTRGATNPLFAGGYVPIDNHLVREWNPTDHDGFGPIGSPLNPKALTGTAFGGTAVAAAFNLGGGGSATAAAITTAKYFEHFSEYAYRFNPSDSLTPPATARYALIKIMSGAAAGQVGFIRYDTTDGNVLHVDEFLSAANRAGLGKTTIGNIAWGAGTIGSNALTLIDPHVTEVPVGSLILECNSYGVPIGRSLMLGAMSAMRGWGSVRAKRDEETHDGGHVKDVFVADIFGQKPFFRADGRAPNFLTIEHAIQYAGIALPIIA